MRIDVDICYLTTFIYELVEPDPGNDNGLD